MLGACDSRAPAPTSATGKAPPATPAVSPADLSYVGRTACAACHQQQSEDWTGSHHDLAMQEATDQTVLGDFNNATFTYHDVTTTFFRKDGEFFARTDGPDGKLHDYPIAYTFGVFPLQQYLIRFPGGGGRIQALNVCWDTRPKTEGGQRWFHLYPDENITHDDVLHWTGPMQNWNHMCAECHSTRIAKNHNAAADSFATTWSEIDVSCEACHGPGSEHVKWAAAHPRSAPAGAAPQPSPAPHDTKGRIVAFKEAPRPGWTFDPATGIAKRDKPRTSHAEIETCARCHSRRGTFSEDFHPGRPLADTHRLALLSAALYEADGQIQDEVYEHGSFVQSKMFAAGVTCTDCHNPHSLKTVPGNAACAKCHLPTKFDTPEHHHHAADSAAARCVSCHAPTKNFMVVHARHDHSFRVPRPDLTVKIGTPNACSGCHTDKTPQWAATAAEKWWGTARRSQPHYGETLSAGRRGLPGSGAALLKLINDKFQPAIVRASAIELLDGLTDADPTATLRAALTDASPQVRAAAAGSLGSLAQDPAALVGPLAPLLTDSIRQVRIDAARSMARIPSSALTPDQQAARKNALDEYRAAERTSADRAESRLNLGQLAADLGDTAQAEAEFRVGIRLNPRFAPCSVNLADLFRAQGKELEAELTLRQALLTLPRDAALHHALGLGMVRQRRLSEALAELKQAADLAPESPRFTYVYAVALGSSGDRDQAMSILRGLTRDHPGDADALEALAAYALESGSLDEAAACAEKLAGLRPNDPGARQLLDQIRAERARKQPAPPR